MRRMTELDILPMWPSLLDLRPRRGKPRRVNTHGDPTFENVMLSQSGELTLIDPLPCSSRMPPIADVDVGKIVQSLLGYERIVAGGVANVWQAVEWLHVITHAYPAAAYFTGVHLVRLMPYQTEELQETFKGVLYDFLSRI